MTTALLFLPSSLLAAGNPSSGVGKEENSAALFRTLGEQAQKSNSWGDACYWYDLCLARDRNQPEVKKSFLFCLRNYYRVYRHNDPSFRTQILSSEFRLPQACAFYEEVLATLQKNYVEQDKASLGRLFLEGVTELKMALEDEAFRVQYIPEGRRSRVPAFIAVLKKRLEEKADFANTGAASTAASLISREAHDTLGIERRIVMVEFACGACNALDEWTFYATSTAAYAREEKSVYFDEKYQEYLKQGIGIVGITHFQDSTAQELESAIDTLKDAGMQVLVLDLRNNRGGSVDAAVDVVRRFLPEGAQIASTAGKLNTPYQSYTMTPLSMPVFVLVNGSTASAAELVAGALKANKRAELVGQTTYGKNWIQQTISLNQGPRGAICVTWAQFFVPNTPDLSKGITPTIAVEANAPFERTREVAVERARTFVVTMMR